MQKSIGVGATAAHFEKDQPRCLNSRRYGNEKVDKSCNSCCRGRGFRRLVCISARAACGQSTCCRSIAHRTIRLVAAASCLGTVDRKSTRLNSSHVAISYAVFCLKKK